MQRADFLLQASPPDGPAEREGFHLKAPEQMAWDMFFAAVASIQYHPANPPTGRMSLHDLACIADMMILIRRERRWP